MTLVMSDPTQELKRRFNDPLAWASVKKGVPIFKPHVRAKTDAEGKKREIKVTESDLSEIVQNTSDTIPIYLGHLNLALPEHDPQQPPLIGYATNLHTGRWGEANEPGILADIYLTPDHYDRARECGRPSVDYYLDGSIGSMALLKRKPELDLGTVVYHNRRAVVQYAFGDEEMPPKDEPEDKAPKLDESEGEPVAPESKSKFHDEMGELTPEHREAADAYMAHAMKHHPMMQYLTKCYEAGGAGAAMGPTNAAMPETKPMPEQMQSGASAVQYAKLERENNAMRDRLAALERDLKTQRAQAIVLQYQNRDFEMDAEDVTDLVAADESRWPAIQARWEKTRRQMDATMRPVPYSADGMVPVAGNVAVKAPSLHAAPAYHDKATQYMRNHPGMSYESAVEHVTQNGAAVN